MSKTKHLNITEKIIVKEYVFSISAELASYRGAIKMRALSKSTFSKKEIAMGIFAINKKIFMRADGTPTIGELANSASAKTPNVFADDSTSP